MREETFAPPAKDFYAVSAAAAVVTATAIAAAAAVAATAVEQSAVPAATAAEEQDKDDDPPAATHSVIAIHNQNLLFFIEHQAHSMLCHGPKSVTQRPPTSVFDTSGILFPVNVHIKLCGARPPALIYIAAATP